MSFSKETRTWDGSKRCTLLYISEQTSAKKKPLCPAKLAIETFLLLYGLLKKGFPFHPPHLLLLPVRWPTYTLVTGCIEIALVQFWGLYTLFFFPLSFWFLMTAGHKYRNIQESLQAGRTSGHIGRTWVWPGWDTVGPRITHSFSLSSVRRRFSRETFEVGCEGGKRDANTCLQIFADRFSNRQPWRKHRDVDKAVTWGLRGWCGGQEHKMKDLSSIGVISTPPGVG